MHISDDAHTPLYMKRTIAICQDRRDFMGGPAVAKDGRWGDRRWTMDDGLWSIVCGLFFHSVF